MGYKDCGESPYRNGGGGGGMSPQNFYKSITVSVIQW